MVKFYIRISISIQRQGTSNQCKTKNSSENTGRQGLPWSGTKWLMAEAHLKSARKVIKSLHNEKFANPILCQAVPTVIPTT